MSRIVSFHLVRERRGRAPLVMFRLVTDRLRLPRAEGLVFWRVLGTGRGSDTGPSIDVRRSALFAVWEDELQLERFLRSGPFARRWARADEAWHVRLRGIGGHGSWRGVDVLDGLEPGGAGGSVVVVTRADVRLRAWRRFARASRDVDAELPTTDGLLALAGIGEAPFGRLGTISVWETAEAAQRFAMSSASHRDDISSTRGGSWFSEELFAWFEPVGSSGTWDGRDPLDGAAQSP
jgi:hypothetical protein